MDFLKKNKALIIQIALGAIMAGVMQILNLPVWFIGAIIAGTITISTQLATKLYDDQVEPRIIKTMEKRTAEAERETPVEVNAGKTEKAEKAKTPRKPKPTAAKTAPKRKPKSPSS